MKRLFLYSLLVLLFPDMLRAQDLERTTEQRLQEYFRTYVHPTVNIGTCELDSLWLDHTRRKLTVFASPAFAYQPFRPEEVTAIYTTLSGLLPGPVCFYDIQIRSGGRAIEDLIPNYYRTGRADRDRLFTSVKTGKAHPWVSNLSRPYTVSRGWKGGTSPSGKATAATTRTRNRSGCGNVPACSVPQKTCLPNPSFSPM